MFKLKKGESWPAAGDSPLCKTLKHTTYNATYFNPAIYSRYRLFK